MDDFDNTERGVGEGSDSLVDDVVAVAADGYEVEAAVAGVSEEVAYSVKQVAMASQGEVLALRLMREAAGFAADPLSHRVLSKDELALLLVAAKINGSRNAEAAIIAYNYKFIKYCVSSVSRKEMPGFAMYSEEDDLMAVGKLAALMAIRNADLESSEQGVFVNYLRGYVIGYVKTGVYKGVSSLSGVFGVVRRAGSIARRLGQGDSRDDIKRDLQIGDEAYDGVSDFLDGALNHYSISEPIYRNGATLLDFLSADGGEDEGGEMTPEDVVEFRALVIRVLKKPKGAGKFDRNVDCFFRVYGFYDDREIMRLEDIGVMYGITRERVRQINSAVLTQLMRNREFMEFVSKFRF